MRFPINILVVDDEADSRDAVSYLLEEMGYSVSAVANGDEALRFVETGGTCDCVVTDVLMPGISGVELALRLRKSNPRLPVILLTGRADGIEAAVDSGGIPMLKPVTPERLSQVLGDAFSRR